MNNLTKKINIVVKKKEFLDWVWASRDDKLVLHTMVVNSFIKKNEFTMNDLLESTSFIPFRFIENLNDIEIPIEDINDKELYNLEKFDIVFH